MEQKRRLLMSHIFHGLDHIQLAAPIDCESVARKFYHELLGWAEIPKPEALQQRGGVWFQCGSHQVHIGVQQDFIPATKAHPAFVVTNLESLQSHLLQHHIEVADDSARIEEGVIRFYVNDPFGNRLEFMEYL